MNKKYIIIIAASAALCFGAAFAFSWFTQKSYPQQPAEQPQQQDLSSQVEMQQTTDSAQRKELSEKQLKNLFFDVKEKVRELESRQKEQELREQRLLMSQDSLKKDVETLDNLRLDIASMITSLKQEQEKLNSSRVKIEQAEKANLITVAATYDKMDPASAGKILTNLSKIPASDSQAESGIDEAVKILHYMTERTKAKVLAELAGTEPALAAAFCDRLKRINQEQ